MNSTGEREFLGRVIILRGLIRRVHVSLRKRSRKASAARLSNVSLSG